MPTANEWITALDLRPHPEGGHFRQTYRCEEEVAHDALPKRFGGPRAFSTAIYFLLAGDDFSALHRIHSDEVWHFYDGATLLIHVLDADGNYTAIRLGRDVANGESPQAVVRAGDYFGASLQKPETFALVGCTVAPGFDFVDFEMPSREKLLQRFPLHEGLVRRLTRAVKASP